MEVRLYGVGYLSRYDKKKRTLLIHERYYSGITSIANDYHFDEIFEKQIRALGKKGDNAIGISTSGNSRNVIQAVAAAKEIGLLTIGLTGPDGKLSEMVDLNFAVESRTTARIQGSHILLGHLLCDIVDRILFPKKF